MAEAKTVQVAEFRGNLSSLLKEVESGTELLLVSRNRAVARVVPAVPVTRRQFGLMKGRIWVAPDFDETPADIIDTMEGGAER